MKLTAMKEYLLPGIQILLGTALTAAAFGLIVVPQGFAAGGITGLARLMQQMMPLPLSWLVMACNLVFLLLGLICVGKLFVAKTVTVSLLFPVFLDVFSRMDVMRGLERDPLVSAVTAGVILGVGVGLILRADGSSGGFDILGVVLNRKLGVPVALVLNVCDGMIIMTQAMGRPLLNTAYGLLVICVSACCVNRVVTLGAERETRIPQPKRPKKLQTT